MLISIDAEKAFNKIQYPFMIKNSYKNGYRGNIPQHNQSHLWQTHSKYNTQWRKDESLHTNILEQDKDAHSHNFYSTLLEVLAIAIREKKEMKDMQIGREEIKWSLYADNMILYIENPKVSTKKIRTNEFSRNFHCGTVEKNLTSSRKDAGSIRGLAQSVKDLASWWALV